MWGNYATVAFRALTKNRTYAFINIVGLAIGLAACLLLLLYVRYETSYDSWLPDAERVYQVQTVITDPDTGEIREMQAAPRPVGAALAKDFPQIEFVSKAESGTVTVLAGGQAEAAEIVMADEPFFRIIAVPFLRGDAASAIKGADSLALSRSEAVKRFGTIDAVGRTLTIVGDAGQRDLKVTAVFADMPKNSHLDFSMVSRFKEEWECDWSCINGPTYLKLKAGADVQAISEALPEWEKRNIPTQMVGGTPVNEGATHDWRLVSLADIHLSQAEGDRPGNDRGTIVTFGVVALLILFMASVNFTNLATARAGQRAREVALRKVLGARRRQLVAQFLGESLLVTAVAMLLALTLVELTLPIFSAFLEAELRVDYFGSRGVLIPALLLILVVGVVGGLYPAFYLSRYMPAAVLKANKSSSDTAGSGRLRTVLVVAQFAVSIGLIICTIVVYHQTLFATRTSAGYDREGLLHFEVRGPEIAPLRDTLIQEIDRIKGVTGISGTQIVPASGQSLYTMVKVPGKADPEKIGWYSVQPPFFSTMRIPMLAGRPLSDRFGNDKGYPAGPRLEDQAARDAQLRGIVARGINVVVNEAAAERLGHDSPQGALGKQIGLPIFGEEFGAAPATIVGVAANSRFRSLRQPVEPSIYYDVRGYRWLVVRYENADPAKVREEIEGVWKRLLPQIPLQVDFTDAKVAEMYEIDAKRGQAFAGFTILAVLIACLGLFGLAAFTAERRTKEIGIRKVFGATVRDIVRLLAWQFSKPVILANLIAWPVAWWVMRDWLNTFDARVALTPTPFVLAGLIALAIAIGTIAGHALKVARSNPIHALRYE